jgi:hypothetical protein
VSSAEHVAGSRARYQRNLGEGTIMITETTIPLAALRSAVCGDPFWENHLNRTIHQERDTVAVHLAILVKPYLQLLLDGEKTVESRFSMHRRAPYDQVQADDIVLLKRSGGPIMGIGTIASAWFFRLNPTAWRQIKETFGQALCIEDPSFWEARAAASFATLMQLQHVRSIPPITYSKRDQRAWVVLQQRIVQATFCENHMEA